MSTFAEEVTETVLAALATRRLVQAVRAVRAGCDLDRTCWAYGVARESVVGLVTADPLAPTTVDRPADSPTVPLGAEEGGS